MRYSIIHTSARPDKWREIYDAWIAAADDPSQIEYCLVVDRRWGFTEFPQLRPQDKAIWATGRKCYVDGVNLGAAASTGDVLIVNADDQFPAPHFDTEIDLVIEQSTLPAAADTGEFVIHAATGTTNEFTRGIIVMPILSRARYERLGYVFYPKYESMYADNDLHDHAQQDRCVIKADHLLFPHRHPLMKCAEWDEAYAAQNRREAYQIGAEVYAARKANGFKDGPGWRPGVTEGVDTPAAGLYAQVGGVPLGTYAATHVKPRLVICAPGEHFSFRWVAAWTGMLTGVCQHFELVPPIFGYSSSVYATRSEMWNEALKYSPDYILWIDDDNPVDWKHIELLYSDLLAVPEADGAAGWAWCIKQDGLQMSAGNFVDHEDWMVTHLPHAVVMADSSPVGWVEWTGFPCILMRRSIIGKLPDKPFVPYLTSKHPMGMAGEDVSFCRWLAERGGKILLDRRVEVPHLKEGPLGINTTVTVPAVKNLRVQPLTPRAPLVDLSTNHSLPVVPHPEPVAV